MEINTQDEKEKLRSAEIVRLLYVARDTGSESLLDEALNGREKSQESVTKLYNFVLKNFGSESIVTAKLWDACVVFLRDNTELTSKELENIHGPFPKAGEPGFRSILDEMHDEGRH